MMKRRQRALLRFAAAAFAGMLLLLGAIGWFLWQRSADAEQQRFDRLAHSLGERTEELIVDAFDALDRLNRSDAPRCSDQHLRQMHAFALQHPSVRAVGYWKAADRLCGVGFIQGIDLRPENADRIYDSGVIAWWPSPQTEVAGVELFLMRYGEHDVAIDPRALLDTALTPDHSAALWVEGLRMASRPHGAQLPPPDQVPEGLSIDRESGTVLSHSALGTIFPIDIVASEPLARFQDRNFATIAIAAAVALVLLALWLYGVYRVSRHHLSLPTELRDSLVNGQLHVEYQPIVDLGTGRCTGAEALARWTREDGEVVGPDMFIPVAERAGLVPRITLVVLDRILHELGALLRADPEFRVNLNLAPEDLHDERFEQALWRALTHAGVRPASIKLEITERALVNDGTAREIIRTLRGRGHEVAVDDFGTGYSSLSYLESFELDTLKIDKTFVDAIGKEAVTSQVIGHVIELSKSLRLDTVAEGVETMSQVDWLIAQDVSSAQGFFFSRPLSSHRFRAYLRATRQNVLSMSRARRSGFRTT